MYSGKQHVKLNQCLSINLLTSDTAVKRRKREPGHWAFLALVKTPTGMPDCVSPCSPDVIGKPGGPRRQGAQPPVPSTGGYSYTPNTPCHFITWFIWLARVWDIMWGVHGMNIKNLNHENYPANHENTPTNGARLPIMRLLVASYCLPVGIWDRAVPFYMLRAESKGSVMSTALRCSSSTAWIWPQLAPTTRWCSRTTSSAKTTVCRG